MRILLTIFVLFLSLGACAQEAPSSGQFKAGVHFQELNTPLRTLSGDKVEVAELFWYGCGHCYNFEPVLNNWKKTLPETANLVKIPGSWRKEHAKVYYLGEMLGVIDAAHGKVFDAIHNDPKGRRATQVLTKEKEIKSFYANLGVDEQDIDKEFSGGSVKLALSFADSNIRSLSQQMAKVGVKVSTPSMIVAGKYYITMNSDVPDFKNMLKVTDYLIAQESAK